MTTNSSKPLKLFYCYAHEDKALRDALDKHLISMKRGNHLEVWYDREISPGTVWEREIDRNLAAAHIILLLISASFLSSEQCCIEMEKALQRHEAGTARVVPILLRPIGWEDEPFSNLQVLPTGAKAVTLWSDRDDAFEDIAKALRKVVKDLRIALKTKEEWVEEGCAFYELKQYKEAIDAHDHAISLEPSYAAAYYNKALALNALKRYKDATVALKKAIELDPNQEYPPWDPPPPPPPPPPPKKSLNPIIIALICLVLIGSVGIYAIVRRPSSNKQTTANTQARSTATAETHATSAALPATGLGVTMINGEPIGVSDGKYVLDIGSDRRDISSKQAAASSLASGDTTSALSQLNQAISDDSNDAEAFIYRENIQIGSSPHITLVVGTMLSGDSGTVGVGRDDLQGAYVAQKEFNDGAKLHGGLKIKLFIANAGSNSNYATLVANQIINLAHSDKTFIGVMGWPYSDYAFKAVQVLGAANIPMVAQTASSDELTGVSPYFFRVAPPNTREGSVDAKYAEHTLHAKSAVIFFDASNLYSQSLAAAFQTQFEKDGNHVITTEAYTVGKPDKLPTLLTDALSKKPDLLYFSGYASDLNTLLEKLPQNTTASIMGGDALYELAGYAPAARAGFTHLHFTAFFYPDVWSVLGQNDNPKKPTFFNDYPATFGTVKTGYHYTRPSVDTALSYDATLALLNAYNLASVSGKLVTMSTIQQALTKTNFQGVSGQIAFDSYGNPINKAILILKVDAQGQISMDAIGDGKFFG